MPSPSHEASQHRNERLKDQPEKAVCKEKMQKTFGFIGRQEKKQKFLRKKFRLDFTFITIFFIIVQHSNILPALKSWNKLLKRQWEANQVFNESVAAPPTTIAFTSPSFTHSFFSYLSCPLFLSLLLFLWSSFHSLYLIFSFTHSLCSSLVLPPVLFIFLARSVWIHYFSASCSLSVLSVSPSLSLLLFLHLSYPFSNPSMSHPLSLFLSLAPSIFKSLTNGDNISFFLSVFDVYQHFDFAVNVFLWIILPNFRWLLSTSSIKR